MAGDEIFNAEQNARLVKNAEAYYRSMFLEEVSSWNLRDRHMVETLEAVMAHLGQNGAAAKLAVGPITLTSVTRVLHRWASAES
jgi:CRISPR type IV-associated protein Csf3